MSADTMQPRFATVLGVPTRYYEAGTGETLLLLHGASLGVDARATFEPVFAQLSRSFRVVALDQAGFGETGPVGPSLFVERYDRIDHAVAFLDTLGVSRATVVGHSEGAFVAMRVAHERPRVVDRLVLVTTGSVAPALGDARDDAWLAATEEAYGYGSVGRTVEELVARSHLLCHREHPRHDEILAGNARAWLDDGRFDALLESAARMEADPSEYMRVRDEYIGPCLGAEVPTLLLWSDADPTVPVARGVALMEQLPQADLVVLKGAAHLIMWDRPQGFCAAITAWDEAAGRTRGPGS